MLEFFKPNSPKIYHLMNLTSSLVIVTVIGTYKTNNIKVIHYIYRSTDIKFTTHFTPQYIVFVQQI